MSSIKSNFTFSFLSKLQCYNTDLSNNSGSMADGDIVVAICQYGGEFTSGPNGNLAYKGGEAHAIDVTRDMPLESFKDEVSKVFNVDVTDMSLKYFLPNNNRTLITISCDRDLQRMVDFTISAAHVDVFLISRVENRFIFVPYCLLCFWKSHNQVYADVMHFSLMLVKQEYHNSHWRVH